MYLMWNMNDKGGKNKINMIICWGRHQNKQDQKSIDAIESDLISETGYN